LSDDDFDNDGAASLSSRITGINHTIFVSTGTGTPRVKIALDPPDTLAAHAAAASMTIDGQVMTGEIPPILSAQLERWISRNRDVIDDYWHYRCDTGELIERLA
jgi:hypothetical protein